MTNKVRIDQGLRQLLSADPSSFLLHAVEQVQEQAHHRRLGRVLRVLRRRKNELGWIHVSDLENECDRQLAAKLLGYHLPREKLEPRQSRIFENGTYMHLRYYNYFLSLPSPFQVQVAAVLRDWPIVGEADIIIYHPELDWQVIELKTMNTDQFKRLNAPLESHTAQVNGYIGLFGKGDGQIWYENKNNQEVKTYTWPYNPPMYTERRERVLRLSESVLAGRLPPCCGSCKLGEQIANLTGVEKRIAQLAEERERWLKKS